MGGKLDRFYDGTGFRDKKLWNWLELLIVPVFIAGATIVFSLYQQRIEDDRVRQSVLESYLQDMTALLLDKELAKSKQDQPVRAIARSSTLAAVRQLDADRKGILLQFLFESNLIEIDPIIHLSGANLSGADLTGANLTGAHLSGAYLTRAILTGAVLRGANPSGADLSGADLSGADLSYAWEWTNEQLARAGSLVGATMPDGTVMTE